MNEGPCPGCGGSFPAVDGPIHRYMTSSPGCWAAYGGVLAREYGDQRYWPVHRLTVDAYAVQHPGQPSPQTVQSVAVHLIGLCLVFERRFPLTAPAVVASLKRVADTRTYPWLEPPSSLGELTVADVVTARSPEEHDERVRAWAESAWRAWADHHPRVRSWADRATGETRPRSTGS